ncbi:HD-GYP domain-containing protein [Rhodocyclus tenuis]|uniref:Putative nucleotidyltransferase with HDIG domain n=1 Tax=Rhodocyclus tenuis TaxID=1066 RepID=A0A840G7Z3_RHOTE|nr:HD-GYP domain-containing protein [Rhodocyclus tenuis]MBB4248005.1 putative nucleotidyltransferase with HDIG domain [Rhodocyclus tenuis]
MIKKIRVEQVRVGMYVHDFNAGWLDHPFARNRMKIASDEELHKLAASGIREIFIDTARGVDVADAPTREEAAAATEVSLLALDTAPRSAVRVALADELTRAKSVFAEGTRAIRTVMEDARLGRQLEIEAMSPVVEKIAASIIRNSNAMMSMRRLKHLDDYTYLHSVAVCTMLAAFARELDMELADIHSMALGGLLHDIGKARVSAAILNKPKRLTEKEFIHVKSHVVLGADMLRQMPGVPPLAFAVLELHHERFDGTGYPQALSGEQISVAGRMAAIVDVYDSITSERCYQAAISPAEAIRKLFEWSHHHFDSQLVQRFVRSVGIYPVGTLVRLESGRLGIVVEQRESSLLTPVVRVIFDARRNYYIPPENVDLSRPLGAGGGDRIVGHESPATWKIELDRFL